LRDRSNGITTLDTYMQALWAKHGRPGQKEPGMVATPYTMDDLRSVLAEVSGDATFAQAFFSSYIQGHDVVDYATLLARAGLILRKRNPRSAFFAGGQGLSFDGGGGARVTSPVPFESWLYKAGVERDDLIISIDGVSMTSQHALDEVLRKHKPGDQVGIRFVQRSGETVNGRLVLEEDPHQEIVPIERTGGTLTEAQEQFRNGWFGSRQK
ncbi:MAG: PDZ domain-containing protein, partial [Vicinamibacterales bacterium]